MRHAACLRARMAFSSCNAIAVTVDVPASLGFADQPLVPSPANRLNMKRDDPKTKTGVSINLLSLAVAAAPSLFIAAMASFGPTTVRVAFVLLAAAGGRGRPGRQASRSERWEGGTRC